MLQYHSETLPFSQPLSVGRNHRTQRSPPTSKEHVCPLSTHHSNYAPCTAVTIWLHPNSGLCRVHCSSSCISQSICMDQKACSTSSKSCPAQSSMQKCHFNKYKMQKDAIQSQTYIHVGFSWILKHTDGFPSLSILHNVHFARGLFQHGIQLRSFVSCFAEVGMICPAPLAKQGSCQ